MYDPSKDPHELCFQDYPKKINTRDDVVECPKCFGHGGWNLDLNQYSLRGKPDTPENRHQYSHFRASCDQCSGGGGYVMKGSKSATCIHVWKETSHPSGYRSGIHTCACVNCGTTKSYDTSD